MSVWSCHKSISILWQKRTINVCVHTKSNKNWNWSFGIVFRFFCCYRIVFRFSRIFHPCVKMCPIFLLGLKMLIITRCILPFSCMKGLWHQWNGKIGLTQILWFLYIVSVRCFEISINFTWAVNRQYNQITFSFFT